MHRSGLHSYTVRPHRPFIHTHISSPSVHRATPMHPAGPTQRSPFIHGTPSLFPAGPAQSHSPRAAASLRTPAASAWCHGACAAAPPAAALSVVLPHSVLSPSLVDARPPAPHPPAPPPPAAPPAVAPPAALAAHLPALCAPLTSVIFWHPCQASAAAPDPAVAAAAAAHVDRVEGGGGHGCVRQLPKLRAGQML
eukprot:1159452-Pelagomonas_calceolata.AAC.8